jgi:hypothetical protein
MTARVPVQQCPAPEGWRWAAELVEAPSLPALKALAAWKPAVEVKWAAMVGRLTAVVGGPARLPLGVATPGTQAA